VRVQPIVPEQYQALADLTVAAYRSLPGGSLSERYEAELRDVAGRDRDAMVLAAAAHHLYERFGFRRAPEFDMIAEDGLRLISYVLTL
jgi:ribosomal protein S18 acetylase RimI-like enzyme